MQRTVLEKFLGLTRATYAWTIDTYPVTKDGDFTFQAEPDGTVSQGPRDAPREVFDLFTDPTVGEKFRMLDDDGIPYFEGRIFIPGDADSGDGSGDVHEAPMWDLGEAYGCTEIQYRVKTDAGGTKWETY